MRSEIFSAIHRQLLGLALALSGDGALATEILWEVDGRGEEAFSQKAGPSAARLKRAVIEASLRRVRIFREELGPKPDWRWSQQLPSPFPSDLTRILFVLRIWEGLPASAVCRLCGILPEEAKTHFAKIFAAVNRDPDILYLFVSSFKDELKSIAENTGAKTTRSGTPPSSERKESQWKMFDVREYRTYSGS